MELLLRDHQGEGRPEWEGVGKLAAEVSPGKLQPAAGERDPACGRLGRGGDHHTGERAGHAVCPESASDQAERVEAFGGEADRGAGRNAPFRHQGEVEARGREAHRGEGSDVGHHARQLGIVERRGDERTQAQQQGGGDHPEGRRQHEGMRLPEPLLRRLARHEVDQALVEPERQDQHESIREQPGLLERTVAFGEKDPRQDHRDGEGEARHPEAGEHQRSRASQDGTMRLFVHPPSVPNTMCSSRKADKLL